MNPKRLLRGLIFIATLVAIGYLLDTTDLGSLMNKAWIDREIAGRGVDGELLFIGIAALATALGLPRQVVAFLGGYAFGFLWGTGFALLGTVLGCIITFFYARWIGRAFVQHRFGERIRRLDDFVSGHPFTMTLLIRLLPVGSNVATNLTAGVTRMSAAAFFLGSAIGYIPQTLVFTLAGSGINLDPVTRIGLAIAIFVVSGALGVYLYRHFRHGHSLDPELDRELGEGDVAATDADTGVADGQERG